MLSAAEAWGGRSWHEGRRSISGSANQRLNQAGKVCGGANSSPTFTVPACCGAVLQSHVDDLSQALAMTGVRGRDRRRSTAGQPDGGRCRTSMRLRQSLYVGEPVATVAADTEPARAAAAAINVTIRIAGRTIARSGAFAECRRYPREAAEYLKSSGRNQDNLCSRTSFREGDIERAGATTSFRGPLSDAAAGARPSTLWRSGRNGANGRVTLWSATNQFSGQANVSEVSQHADVAAALPHPAHRRRFGNKMEPHISRSRCYWR